MTRLCVCAALTIALLLHPQRAGASSDWDCGGGGVLVWFELGGGEVGGIFGVSVGGQKWRRYPLHESPKYLPLKRQRTRTGNTSVLLTYSDKLTGEPVLKMRFDDVPAGSFNSDHGILWIKDEGTWNVTCSNG